jgi:predicted acetyltransferase
MMSIQLLKADASHEEVIANLVSLYIYDLSEHMCWRCPESGRYAGEVDLPQYWGKPVEPRYTWSKGSAGYPFIVRVDGELAGFSLVKRIGDTSPPHFEIGAFFVLRKFRRNHVGEQVARDVFAMFPGDWTVGSMVGNAPANAFWKSVIAHFTDNQFETTEGKDDSDRFDMIFHHFRSNELAKQASDGAAWCRPSERSSAQG